MFNNPMKNHEVVKFLARKCWNRRVLLPLVILGVLAVAATVVARRASAFTTPLPTLKVPPKFDPHGTLSADGRAILASGPYVCSPHEGEAIIQAVFSQESTGASATGEFQGPCTGRFESFVVEGAVPEDAPAFQEGRVSVVALGVNRRGHEFTDAVLWGRFIVVASD